MSAKNIITWELQSDWDDEEDWRGYVNEIEIYRILHKRWSYRFDYLVGGTCKSLFDGKKQCLQHLQTMDTHKVWEAFMSLLAMNKAIGRAA
jgi:hypothetical protein